VKATFKIQRFDPITDKQARWQTVEVDLEEGATVLDGLEQIKAEKDGTLSFRRSCRSAICGSCAMHINGRQALACKSQVGKEMGRSGEVRVQPLCGMAVIKDLVVDMDPFWRKIAAVKPWLMPDPNEPEPERERLMSRKDLSKLEKPSSCILCAICYGDCPMAAADWDYLGPAQLVLAYRFIKDPRDKATRERLDIVGADRGVWRCHTVFNCTEACPKDIEITSAIQELKRKAALRWLGFGRQSKLR
jgi:succinate dehydrogenase / fumarate reductase, iron-sulfur subunit